MTASTFARRFASTRNLRLRVNSRGSLVVRGTLTDEDQRTLAAHRRAIARALRGSESELAPVLSEADYERAGLMRLNDVPGKPWTHPRGDEHAQAILTGLIPLSQALAESRVAEREHQQIFDALKKGLINERF